MQVQKDDDTWLPWLVDADYTQATYVGDAGHSYTFRIKATDNVDNTNLNWELTANSVSVEAVTKYYTFGGQKVAMRQGSEVYYLGGDHLGSTSLTTDSTGGVVSEVRYRPYGEVRWSNGTSVTDFGFTSQRNEASFGLLDYNARYYSAVLGRFVSPDSIVPDPSSSGGFNRYRYTRNNPLRYTDPSGHICDEGGSMDVDKMLIYTPCDGGDDNSPPPKENNEETVVSALWPFPGSEEYIYEQPPAIHQPTAKVFSSFSIAADVTAWIISGVGTGGEWAGVIAGIIGEPTFLGEPVGFAGGTMIYNKSGMNKFGDQIGIYGAIATTASDIFASESYFVNNENEFSVIMGSETQFSLLMGVAGVFSPIANVDFVIDSAALYNNTASINRATNGMLTEEFGINHQPLSDYIPPRRIIHHEKQ